MRKKISILGSTGSIGKQALEVIDSLPEQFEIVGLSAGSNIELLKQQIKKYNPKIISVKTEESAIVIKKVFPNLKVTFGQNGLLEIAANNENELILIALTGFIGLYPTLAAIENGIDIALANKETLVAAGDIVMQKAKAKSVNIIPVDSEHSAIHQCVTNQKQIKKLLITASGGPFRNKTLEEMSQASVSETLAHPKWLMGDKITIDSATLMNKGLEVIEAHHLFNVDYENIEVIIHPQSIMHSAVEYIDGSVISQMGVPSMHIPIQYALTYPERLKGLKSSSMSFVKAGKLEFFQPDLNKFPCLELAYKSGKQSGIYPAVLNAANEESVKLFLDGKIKLTNISQIVESILLKTKNILNPSLEEITKADQQARKLTIKAFTSKDW